MTKIIYAIIPARQGSKGLPDKNIKLLGGHPLLAYSIAAALMTPEISRVIVSTDSNEYAEIAKKYGAETPFLRPQDISNDRSTDLELFQHCFKWLEDHEKILPQLMVHLRPTTPLRIPSYISEALNQIMSSPQATSLRSGHLSPESPYKWFKKNKDGFFTTLNDDQNVEATNRARQEYPDVYIPDGYVDVIRTELVENEKQLHGNKVIAFETPFCVEIDSIDEFNYLEYLIQKNGSPLKDYLDKKL